MNLYQLKVFYYTLKYGSVSKAANHLFITQPAVTKQLQRFQKHYNIQFLNKAGKMLVPTDAGKELYSLAEKIFEIENEVEEIIKDYQQLKTGQINILTSESFGAYYLPFIIAQFNKKYPHIRLSVNILTVDEVIENTLHLNCDLGFVSFIKRNPRLVAKEILNDIIVCIVPPNHPFSHKKYILPEELENKPIIMAEKYSTTRTIVDNFFTKHHYLINNTLELSNNEAIKRAVENGMGISLISLNVVHEEVKHGTLKAILIKDNSLIRKFYMIYHKNKYFSPALNLFINTVNQWTSNYCNSLHHIIDEIKS